MIADKYGLLQEPDLRGALPSYERKGNGSFYEALFSCKAISPNS